MERWGHPDRLIINMLFMIRGGIPYIYLNIVYEAVINYR